MKRIVFVLLMAVIARASLLAQEGEIIYTDYGPDGWSYEFGARDESFDTLQIDLDNDGEIDLFYHGEGWTFYCPAFAEVELDSKYGYNNSSTFSCFCTHCYSSGELNSPYILYYGSYGDTISNAPSWYKWYGFNHGVYEGAMERPNARYKGFRFPNEDGSYCYGWVEDSIQYIRYPEPSGSYWGYYHNALLRVYRWAYCTIPNYPLRLGQTSLTEGFEETEATTFASIYPNPAKNTFTVTGKDLKQAEVLNALGQQVATAQGKGETLQIDIANLPAGVYFVRITDEEGRKCVRKVVKE